MWQTRTPRSPTSSAGWPCSAVKNALLVAQTLEYDFGDLVYPVTGEQKAGIVVGINLEPGSIRYIVSRGSEDERAYLALEISKDKNPEEA